MRAGLCAIVRRATLAAMPARRHTNYAHRLARVIVLNDGTVIVTCSTP